MPSTVVRSLHSTQKPEALKEGNTQREHGNMKLTAGDKHAVHMVLLPHARQIKHLAVNGQCALHISTRQTT